MGRIQPFVTEIMDESQGGANTKAIHMLLENLHEVIQAYHHKLIPKFILFSMDFYKASLSLNLQYLFHIPQTLNLPET